MTRFAASTATSEPALVRLTLTLGPEDRRAVARLVARSGAASRTDGMRDLVARLATCSDAVRDRLLSASVPPLPADTSESRRLDLRLAASDRAALDEWCAGELRPQDALRAALHSLGEDMALARELGYRADPVAAAPPPTAPATTAEPEAVRRPDRRHSSPQPPRHRERPRAAAPPPDRPEPKAPRRARRRPPPAEPTNAWWLPSNEAPEPWPPSPRRIPKVEVANSWETRSLLQRLKSGREPIQFGEAWTDEVQDAVEDLVEVLSSGDSVTVVVGYRRREWEELDEEGDRIAAGMCWELVPVRRPKSVAHDMLVSAHAAGGVDLEGRVHRIEDETGTGAIVELVATGPF